MGGVEWEGLEVHLTRRKEAALRPVKAAEDSCFRLDACTSVQLWCYFSPQSCSPQQCSAFNKAMAWL